MAKRKGPGKATPGASGAGPGTGPAPKRKRRPSVKGIHDLATNAPDLPPPIPDFEGKVSTDTLLSVPLNKLATTAVAWVLPGVLARGCITLIEGDPGTGKSLLALDLAAALSRGRLWAGVDARKGGRILVMSAQDDPRSVIRPRLQAAGAYPLLVHLVQWDASAGAGSRPTFPGRHQELVRLLRGDAADLLVLDLLDSWTGPGVDLNTTPGAKEYMGCLEWIAQEAKVSILGIRHHNKSTGQRVLHRGAGSLAISGAARIVLTVARKGTDGPGIVAGVKSNLGPLIPAQGFLIEEKDGYPLIRWTGPPADDLETLIQEGSLERGERSKRVEAEKVIRRMLTDGWVLSSTIIEVCRRHGIGERTVWAARAALGLPSRPVAGGRQSWEWGPPEGGWPDELSSSSGDVPRGKF